MNQLDLFFKLKRAVVFESVERNRTYLHAVVNGRKYGQSYPNTVNTREGMLNDFLVNYFPFVCSDNEE